MFLDAATQTPRTQIADGVAALFEAEPDFASRRPRTVSAILTAQYAAREARLLAPALRACRAMGDEVKVFLLPASGESLPSHTRKSVGRTLDVERIEPIPPPRPPVARGPAQSEMRHAYRVYEFLKPRAPDIVVSTQAFGAPYFAIRARELDICLQRTRFVIVLAPFELQRRLNEGLVTARPYTLIRFELERASVENADVCVAPSHRFVENAVKTGAAVETSRFAVLPEIDVSGPKDPAPGRFSRYVIPDAPPLERNIAFFATVAKRHPDMLRNAKGRIRLCVAAADRKGEIAASCGERFAETDVEWTVGGAGKDTSSGEALLFAPFCEDFFALGRALAPAVRGAPLIVGKGAAAGEPFEATGIAVPPFPDAVAEAIAEAAAGRRTLRVAARPADLETPWTRFLGNLAPPEPPVGFPGAPRVTVCLTHFNRPKLVEAALSSALGQTCEQVDVVICDDGSDAPGAVETLKKLAGANGGRVRLLRQDNRYPAAARNTAARAADGEYLYFLDDDNVLKPHAIDTLVRAAHASGADFVGSFSDIFTGEEAPEPGAVATRRILQTGNDGGSSLLYNAILDGNALCRRDAFLDLGGNTEHYGVGREDHELFARAICSGQSVTIVPEALFWARRGQGGGIKSLHFSRNAGHFRVLEAYWPVVDARYRGLLLLLQGMFIERFETSAGKPESMADERESPVKASARNSSRLRAALLKGREAVAALIIPASWRARRVTGAVENRPRPELRGWALDPKNPERSRRVAIHLDGRLHEVISADRQRSDIARWKGTDGRHGFLWRIPEGVAAKNGTRIEVYDGDTGRPLRGSPVRIEGGQVVTSTRRET